MAIANTIVSNIQTTLYTDANLNVSESADREIVRDETAINNSIIAILTTPRESRVFNRDFGSNIMNLLFDPMDEITASRIRIEVIEAIQKWEYRVSLTSAAVLPDFDNQQYYVEIEYTIPSLQNRDVTLKFNLVKG